MAKNKSKGQTVEAVIKPFGEAFIAKDLLPESLSSKIDEILATPKYDDWVALSGMPSQEEGEDYQGLFTQDGITIAFRDICDVDLPSYLKPIMGEVRSRNKRQERTLTIKAAFQCPPEKIQNLKQLVEQSWTPDADDPTAMSVQQSKLKNPEANSEYGLEFSDKSFEIRRTPHGTASDSVYSYYVTMDPVSGFVLITKLR